MDVNVQVRNFLERRLANRVPETQALIGKSTADSTSDARHHGHECSAGSVIKFAHIMQMPPRNDERMARVELPQVNDGQCQIVLAYDAGWLSALRDSTKDAPVRHGIPHYQGFGPVFVWAPDLIQP